MILQEKYQNIKVEFGQKVVVEMCVYYDKYWFGLRK